MNNIILCGFMGCGKSTVGKQLACMLDMEYLDLDTQIEKDAGLSIPEIFARHGEAHFRDLEHQAVRALSRRINCVVSTGGGALTYARNTGAIDSRDLVVFLDVPFEICYERIRDSGRPIVHSRTADELKALFDSRREAYLSASRICVNANLPAVQVAEAIAQLRESTLLQP